MNFCPGIRKLFFMILALVTSSAFAQHADFGKTTFPTSGAPEAQDAFLKGLLMLHSFQYEDAREAFQEASQIDPDFAMAHWGEAMTHNHPIWQRQNLEAARAALQKLGSTSAARIVKAGTEREKNYLHTLDVLFGEGEKRERDFKYADALADLAAKYPNDLDAAAFHSLAILGTSHDGRDFSTYMKAAAIVEEVFDKNPEHPGAAHYLIHSYDDPIHAPLGLRPAQIYAKIAPSAAHALHMPSHIFFALGMWDLASKSNEDSYAAARNRADRRGIPMAGHGTHALIWLSYGYLQQGMHAAASRPLRLLEKQARKGSRGQNGWLLTWAANVIDREAWDGELINEDFDISAMNDFGRVNYHFIKGLAALKTSDQSAASQALEKMESITVSSQRGHNVRKAEILCEELAALVRLAEGKPDAAIAAIKKATDAEDSLPLDFGPPSPVKPSHELFGEMLLQLGQPKEAVNEFKRALERAPRRTRSLLGLARAALQAQQTELAQGTAVELSEIWNNADVGIPGLQEIKRMATDAVSGTH